MTKTSIENLLPLTNASDIRLGGVFRLPPVVPALAKTDTTDLGRIRLGGVFRLAA